MFTDMVRKYFRVVLEPLARFVSTIGISPNFVTILGFLLMIGVAAVLAQGYLFLGGILITFVSLLDALDGTLARMIGQTTRFGAFLDSTMDRLSESVTFLGLFIYLSGQTGQTLELILIYVTVVASLMVSYTRARAEGIGIPLKDGLFTRFERVFLLVVGLLLNQLTIVLWLLAILSIITAIQRIYLVWQKTTETGG